MFVARDILTVHGADTQTFLQGQISQDLSLADTPKWTLLLEPNGKIVALGLVKVIDETKVQFSLDPGSGEAVQERLERFKIRTEVEMDLEQAVFERKRRSPSSRAADWEFSWAGEDFADYATTAVVSQGDRREIDNFRVELNMPATGVELSTALFANAVGARILRETVSSSKGCYTGQELVARTTSREVMAPDVLVRLRGSSAAPEPGAVISLFDTDAVGVVTTVSIQSGFWMALGVMSRASLIDGATVDGLEVSAKALG